MLTCDYNILVLLFLFSVNPVLCLLTTTQCFQQTSYYATRHQQRTTLPLLSRRLHAVKVWVELAEDGFVDEDENLMTGETCLRAVKAYAASTSSTQEHDTNHNETTASKRFLCAGALVQRPNSQMCDAWMADCLLDETNLQLQGALLILDDLFEFHLRRNTREGTGDDDDQQQQQQPQQHKQYDFRKNVIHTFVVQSGSLDSEYHCASYMAATLRGFRPFKDISRDTAACISKDFEMAVVQDEEDPNAMIFDLRHGLEQYMSEKVQSNSPKARSIANILSKEEKTIRQRWDGM